MVIVTRGVVGCGRHPLTALHEMNHRVSFMYICDLADVWRPPTSFLRTTVLIVTVTGKVHLLMQRIDIASLRGGAVGLTLDRWVNGWIGR